MCTLWRVSHNDATGLSVTLIVPSCPRWIRIALRAFRAFSYKVVNIDIARGDTNVDNTASHTDTCPHGEYPSTTIRQRMSRLDGWAALPCRHSEIAQLKIPCAASVTSSGFITCECHRNMSNVKSWGSSNMGDQDHRRSQTCLGLSTFMRAQPDQEPRQR